MGWREWLIEKLSVSPPSPPEITTENISIDKIKAEQQGVAIGTIGGGTVVVYNLQVPDSVVHLHASKIDLPKEKARQISHDFLTDIEHYYRYLPFKGMGKTDQLHLRIPLINLFIPINARLTLPRGDRLDDSLRLAGKRLSGEEAEHLGGRLDSPIPILELVIKHPVLVILGDPGSGKSTVLRFLAFILATGQGEAFGMPDYLPLLLPLAAYSDKLSGQPDLSLRRFALEYFQARMDLDDLSHLLDARLAMGRALILLDGLDEVKEIQQRNVVVDRVQQFLSQHVNKGNRVILTSRIIGYQEVRPVGIAGLRECTLLDFNEEEVNDFIRRWTQTIESLAFENARVSRYEAGQEAAELIAAVQENKGISKLAANPLLLTMLVIQKRQGVSLPRHRVLLYEQYIKSLLHDWLLARSQHNNQLVLPDELELRKVLEPLAWWMQESEPGQGLVNEAALLGWLQTFFKERAEPEAAAYQFLKDVREHSGLLLDRGGRRYGFMHLTFMEYLAGVALTKYYQQSLQTVVDLLVKHAGQSEWRETILLAISYLGIKQEFADATAKLLQQLLDISSTDPGLHFEIVAAALADMGQSGVTEAAWRQLREQLIADGMRSEEIPATRRVAIGLHVDIAGDPRLEIRQVDAMQFCVVPAGDFFLGSTKSDSLARDDELQGAGIKTISKPYAIARSPVTVAQFRQFVEETDYHFKRLERLRGQENTPIVYVSWRDAMAFCDWLTARWQEHAWLPEDWRVTLPSEPEWEKAARGGLEIPVEPNAYFSPSGLMDHLAAMPALKKNERPQRIYPWGDDLNKKKGNFAMNIGSVSAVGCYPQGHSPYGCEEMSGNVREWTCSVYKATYPEIEALWEKCHLRSEQRTIVLRGGAFNYYRDDVRCAARYHNSPDYRGNLIGFRVVLSPLR